MRLRIFLVVGARPNFMKIAPIYAAMTKASQIYEPIIVHTGQHYDANMSKVFFHDLGLPVPDIYLGVGSGSHAVQTAEIMKRFEPELLRHRPDLVVVVGDVNSTIACAMTAIKSRIPSEHLSEVWERYEQYLQRQAHRSNEFQQKRIRSHAAPLIAHVEAGLRSFDSDMPEEINRVQTDILSDLLFTTSADDDQNLIAEGIDLRKIFMVGNVMIDSLKIMLDRAKKSTIIDTLVSDIENSDRLQMQSGEFALVTLHRPSNVDDADKLKMLLSALIEISDHLPIIFPVHPRTRKRIENAEPGLLQKSKSRLLITTPLGYLDFLHLQTKARLVLTDSGGIQVETCYLGVPCLTLRPNTEWLITIEAGTNRLVPLDKDAIVTAAHQVLFTKTHQPAQIPRWDGCAAQRIVDVLTQILIG